MTDPKYTRYTDYAGFIARGDVAITASTAFDKSQTLDRAVMIAAELEAGSWGTVQSYDGCGISGGILHNTATFPGKQGLGSLWPLLEKCEAAIGERVYAEIAIKNGIPTLINNKMTGDDIRFFFTGHGNGKADAPPKVQVTPDVFQQRTARLRTVLSDPRTYPVQIDAARRWVQSTLCQPLEQRGLFAKFLRPNSTRLGTTLRATDFKSPDYELAYCVTLAFGVNSPGLSFATLAKAAQQPDFPHSLYDAFAAARESGGWATRLKNTARAVKGLKLWSEQTQVDLQAAAKR